MWPTVFGFMSSRKVCVPFKHEYENTLLSPHSSILTLNGLRLGSHTVNQSMKWDKESLNFERRELKFFLIIIKQDQEFGEEMTYWAIKMKLREKESLTKKKMINGERIELDQSLPFKLMESLCKFARKEQGERVWASHPKFNRADGKQRCKNYGRAFGTSTISSIWLSRAKPKVPLQVNFGNQISEEKVSTFSLRNWTNKNPQFKGF